MTLLREQDLRELTEQGAGPCVSIFMPTHRGGRDTRQDPVRFKNLLRAAGEKLSAMGVDAAPCRQLLAPAQDLLQNVEFWRHQNHGLAVFLAPDLFRHFCVPLPFDETLEVNHRFHFKPLLPLLSEDERFYLLALSQHKVQLFEATRESMKEVELPGVPHTLSDAVGFDYVERSLQFHTRASNQTITPGSGGSSAGGMRRRAMYFGHGESADQNKDEITRFARRVDEGLHKLLPDRHVPMIVAAVEFVSSIFHNVSDYPRLVEHTITGNPDHLSEDALLQRARPVMQERFETQRQQQVQRFRELSDTARACADLPTILVAAFDGRIETLFVASDVQVWGRFDQRLRRVERHFERESGDIELLDAATFQALRSGAVLYALPQEQMPAPSIAAVFRY